PMRIGAIAPSSRELGAAMADLVPADATEPVIELGGGTGAITSALLDAGIAADRLVVVEFDEALHKLLVERFPGVRVLRGDAAHLTGLVRPLGIKRVSAVVSGLPLLTMKKPVAQHIVEEGFALLAPGAPFIQFTYGPFSPIPYRKFGVRGEVKRRVLNNLLPASVWMFYRAAGGSAAA